jgi:hypothetical protein
MLDRFYSSFIGVGNNMHLSSMIGINFREKHQSILSSPSIEFYKINKISNNNINKINNIVLTKKKLSTLDKNVLILNINTLVDKLILVQLYFENKILYIFATTIFIFLIYILLFVGLDLIGSRLMILNFNIAVAHSVFNPEVDDRYVGYVFMLNLVIFLLNVKKIKNTINLNKVFVK